MKFFTRPYLCLLVGFVTLFGQIAVGQTGVLNQNDPIVIYNPASPPTIPPNGTLVKWVKTNRVSFNTTSFKCYFYKGVAFRLKYPKTYQQGVNDGKLYPLYLFWHGIGEKGTIYDNEYQLFHGGPVHMAAVDNGTFDGYLLYPQSSSPSGFFGNTQYDVMAEFITNYLIPQVKVDPYRIFVDGLSGGGTATWGFCMRYPKLIAALGPISAASTAFNAGISNLKYTPIWQHQGGLDLGPTPATTSVIVNAYLAAGANFRYKIYPTLGHGCWDSAWAEPDYYPYILRAHKANPWTLYGRTQFCPGDPIRDTIGLTPGFNAYQWRKDGVVIPGAIGNFIVATSIGTYDCRFQNGTVWSPWSPTPVVISIKAPTVTPAITINGLMSKVIPAPDGNTSVQLRIPDGFATYNWQKVPNPTVLGTSSIFNATSPGDYKVQATEQFGCSSAFSPNFTVVDANGPNKPDPATSLKANTLSKTAIELDWSQTLSPQYNETNFEIYEGTKAGGPYHLIALTGPDVATYNVNGLNAGSKYFFVVRAVNNTGASAVTTEVTSTTQSDSQAPSAPGNLTITGTSLNSIALSWNPSTDDVGVTEYDIYVNGIKTYVTTQTQYAVYNLVHGKTYTMVVKAKDFANNISVPSNQVSGEPLAKGLSYKYYTFTGTWSNLANLTPLIPVSAGVMPNFTLTPATQTTNFAFLYEGVVNIPVTGTYTFRTTTDDGSKLYLGTLNSVSSPYDFGATANVNNDGAHAARTISGTSVTLQAGFYPIAVAFFQSGGGSSIVVQWRNPQTSNAFVNIPDSAFVDKTIINGQVPANPSNLAASAISYKQINTTWTDNSNNEKGFEVWRSLNKLTGFSSVGTVGQNSTSFADSNALSASTNYYYRVKAIGSFGESTLVPNGNLEAKWDLNNSYADSSQNNRTLTAVGSPTFDAANKMEGSHSLLFNGTSQSLNLPNTGGFLQTGYSAKTISFWMRSNNNTGNRIIADIGGNDNGLALRLDQSRLYAGVASANNRVNFFASFTSTAWNHVALVYNGNSLLLYVNGVLAGSNTSLPFGAIGNTTNASRIGTNSGTNAFNTGTGFFSGWIDNFAIYNTALSVSDIATLMSDSYGLVSATTSPLPPLPTAPSSLSASSVSASKILVTWTDNAVNETKYEVYRSVSNNTTYSLLATLPANAASYPDTGLIANTTYYYKARAANQIGYSNYSNEGSATTADNPPSVAAIAGQYMHFGTTLQLSVKATDPDPETLNIVVTGLPSFGTFTPNGTGTGIISFNNPDITQQNTYPGITITVNDQHGGTASTSFTLVVNDNYNPVLSGAGNVTVKEKQTAQINLTATDQNASDVLTWSFTGMPAFATVTTTSGSAQINLAPGYADNGTYNVTAKVDDGHHGFDSASFVITVIDVNPNSTIFVNFTDGTLTAPAPWNNTAKIPALNDVFGSLKDSTGATTSVAIKLNTLWSGVNNAGVNTGNNSGVYPDNVLRSSYYTTSVQNLTISGLDLNHTYNFTFLGSRANPVAGVFVVGTYTIGAQALSLDAANNSTHTVTIPNVTPAVDGTVTLTVQKATGSSFAYLNSMVIQSVFNDGTAPAKPRNIAANLQTGKVQLTWVDAAYNETAYEVYRATAFAGPYTLLNPGGNNPNLQVYNDSTVTGNRAYYYAVRAVNSYGGTYSDTVSVTTPNGSPIIAPIANVVMKTTQTVDVNITASDDPGDVIKLTASGLPAFASFTDNGGGSGSVHIAPGNTTGTFGPIVITATDDKGASSTKNFKISVTDINSTYAYVNFNGLFPESAPWNNTNSVPNAGVAIGNLKDADGNNTGIALTLVDSWTNVNYLGVKTGDNSGIYPDTVMQTFYYESSTTAKHILLSGLSSSRKYNLVFFASRGNFVGSLITNYTVGSSTVSLDAANNSTNTVQINGVSPDINGQITVTVTKAATSPNAYIGAMVIQSYPYDGTPIPPTNLTATGTGKDRIQLNWQSGADNATGYEVWRSTSSNGTYAKIADVAATSTTYLNTGLPASSIFYYQVRSVVNTLFSPFSNTASASTVAFTVNLNLNDGTSAPAQPGPWNNTNALIDNGFVMNNLINDQSLNTGINFTLIRGFAGFNTVGATTGNNSGIYPDNVMKSLYYVNFADSAIIKISGLSQTYLYNFSFFGSRANPVVGVTTTYRIGAQTVQLDATNNTSRTAQINSIKPDATGAVYISLSAAINGGFGYLNELSIQGVPNTDSAALAAATAARNAARNGLATENGLDPNAIIQSASAFPNPFQNDVTLRLSLKDNVSRFTVLVTDMSGKTVYRKEFHNAEAGVWQQQIGLNTKALNKGVYVVQIEGIANEKPKVFKVIKQ